MTKRFHFACFSLIVILALAACSQPDAIPPTTTPDLQATIDAAVAATATAQAEAGVSEEYTEMSEEELAEMIAAYAEASLDASEEAGQAVDDAAADGTITKEEQKHIEMVVSDAEQAISDTDEAIYAYFWLFGDLAEETLYLLEEVEDDLDELAALTIELVELLLVVEDSLDHGLDVAIETIEKLESAASEIQTRVEGWQGKGETWLIALQSEMESRVSAISAIKPSEIPGSRREALLSTFGYVDTVRDALVDQKLSFAELANIGQIGANAMAGLDAFGGPNLQGLSGNIQGITGQLARGQIPSAQSGLSALEGALGSRPSR